MSPKEKIVVWKVVNDIRRKNGQCELLMADWVAFLRAFEEAAVSFDAFYSEAVKLERETSELIASFDR